MMFSDVCDTAHQHITGHLVPYIG